MMDGCVDGWIDRWTGDEWMGECMDDSMVMDRQVGQMDGWMDKGCVDGWGGQGWLDKSEQELD